MKSAVLFDLGNTLAAYYHADEFLPILEHGIRGVLAELKSRNLTNVPFDEAIQAARAENIEAQDFRFTPMAERFERIFGVSLRDEPLLSKKLCEIFLQPIFNVGRIYEDTFPTLNALRNAGHPTAIVSNAPWGSPSELWHEELDRLGLKSAVGHVVLCGDVGWRKPAARIFEFAAAKLDRPPKECIFVGDDIRWDISGSEAAGMRAVLIDRDHRHQEYGGFSIGNLSEILEAVGIAA